MFNHLKWILFIQTACFWNSYLYFTYTRHLLHSHLSLNVLLFFYCCLNLFQCLFLYLILDCLYKGSQRWLIPFSCRFVNENGRRRVCIGYCQFVFITRYRYTTLYTSRIRLYWVMRNILFFDVRVCKFKNKRDFYLPCRHGECVRCKPKFRYEPLWTQRLCVSKPVVVWSVRGSDSRH